MKATLITGASSGIGEAFARRLAADGHDLFLVARSEEKLCDLCTELSEKHGITAKYLSADLGKDGADDRVFQETKKLGIEIDWLINNAGFGSMGDFAKLDHDRELEMIRLNISALVGLTHKYLDGMRKRKRGTIINVSSAAGFQPVPYMATYAATKSFVTAFSEAIAEENHSYGIQVLALCPGSTKTNFFEASNIERAFAAKGQQTVDQVIDTAMSAVGTNRSKIVSGWTNWFVASATNFVPNSLITKVVGKGLRKKYQSE
ncbi:MAG TPA: SDR family oxidoreductase [Pyrinomonadaceae bacterium]|nr:SDR family oxidoreductase [Pyrinomonadaceae bacterium]